MEENSSGELIKQQATVIYGSPLSDRLDVDRDDPFADAVRDVEAEKNDFAMMPSKRVELLRKLCESRDALAKASQEARPRAPPTMAKPVREAFGPQSIPSAPALLPEQAQDTVDTGKMDPSVLAYQQVAHYHPDTEERGPLTISQMMHIPIRLDGSTILDKREAEEWMMKQYEKNLAATASARNTKSSGSDISSTSASTLSAPSSSHSSPAPSVAYLSPRPTDAAAAAAEQRPIQLNALPVEFEGTKYSKIIRSVMIITRGALCAFGWKCWRTNPCGGGELHQSDNNRGTYEHGCPIDPESPEDLLQYQACLAFLRRCQPQKGIKTPSDLFLPMVREYIRNGLRKHPLQCARAVADDAIDVWLRDGKKKNVGPIKKGIFMIAAIYLEFVDLDSALDHASCGPGLSVMLPAKEG